MQSGEAVSFDMKAVLAFAAALAVGSTPVAVSRATTVPEEDINAWAIEYTGGSAGAASGEPVRIGYANTEAIIPEATVGARAAVEYVNAELGGIQGRPIELVECQVNTAEDGRGLRGALRQRRLDRDGPHRRHRLRQR